MTINIAIFGYGNLGKGVEAAIPKQPDMNLAGIFTRRDPKSISPRAEGVKVYQESDLEKMKDAIDVLILCGGSATDLPTQTPRWAGVFNVIDSFDTHANIPEHFAAVDKAAKSAGKTAVISCGWDPGMFSLNRVYANAILPDGSDYTFWGKGVSQGHSDAIRRIEGVVDARQYTIPIPEAVDSVRTGKMPTLTTRQKHIRECFVVAEEGADHKAIEEAIVTMPNYFADYDTTVHFIDQQTMERDHRGLPHGGNVIRSGKTGFDNEHNHIIEYKLTLDSNPEFTGSVLVACARAAFRMNQKGDIGCKTILDIPPAMLSADSPEFLRAHML